MCPDLRGVLISKNDRMICTPIGTQLTNCLDLELERCPLREVPL